MWERQLYVYDIVDGACSAFFIYCWTQDQISLLLELCFVPFDQLVNFLLGCIHVLTNSSLDLLNLVLVVDIRVQLFQKWTESS
jgi:hypothetical protein